MSRAASTTVDGVTDTGEDTAVSTTTPLDRFTCSDEFYLERHHIRSHLLDALSLVATAPPKMKPIDFLAAYFTHLSNSVTSHLMHRDFKYINSNPSTRLAFIQLFRSSFHKLSEKTDASVSNNSSSPPPSSSLSQSSVCTPETFHQLCCILCNDFPFSLVRNAARITTAPPPTPQVGESPTPLPAMSFNEFAHKLFVLFFFSEFLNQCALTFRSLDSGGTGRVSRSLFQMRLHEVARKKREEFSCPHSSAIDEALKPSAAAVADEDILFNSFCVNLFSHPKIYEALASDGI